MSILWFSDKIDSFFRSVNLLLRSSKVFEHDGSCSELGANDFFRCSDPKTLSQYVSKGILLIDSVVGDPTAESIHLLVIHQNVKTVHPDSIVFDSDLELLIDSELNGKISNILNDLGLLNNSVVDP